jgi:hypothetical protein
MKVCKWLLLIGCLAGVTLTTGCYRYARGPKVIVDTVRTPRCIGRRWTYVCRYRRGHLKREVIRCRTRYGRMVTRRRTWRTYDRRCAYRHRRHRRRYRRAPSDEIIP